MAKKKKDASAAEKRSGRLMLRMDPDIHARVAKTAKALGMDMNGLLNLLIRTNLMWYEVMADYTSDPKTATLVRRWRELNPLSDPNEFFEDFYLLRRGHPRLFADRKWYRIGETDGGYDFIETEGPPVRYEDDTRDAPPGDSPDDIPF